jgi:hypothetical protein
MTTSDDSEPTVQPAVAYGRRVARKGGVLKRPDNVLPILSVRDRREAAPEILPATGGCEARLCTKMNRCEALINPVKEDSELKLLDKALTKRCAAGSRIWRFRDVDVSAAGEKTPSSVQVLSDGNRVSLYKRLYYQNADLGREGHHVFGNLLQTPFSKVGTSDARHDHSHFVKGRLTAREAVAYAGK